MNKLLIEISDYGGTENIIIGPCVDDILDSIKIHIVDTQDDEDLNKQFDLFTKTFVKTSERVLETLALGLRSLPFGDVMGDTSYKFGAIQIPDIELTTNFVILDMTNPQAIEVKSPSIEFVKDILTKLYSDPDIDPDIVSEVQKYLKKKNADIFDGFDYIYTFYENMCVKCPYIIAYNAK